MCSRQGTLNGHLGKPALSEELRQEAGHIVPSARKTVKNLDRPVQKSGGRAGNLWTLCASYLVTGIRLCQRDFGSP